MFINVVFLKWVYKNGSIGLSGKENKPSGALSGGNPAGPILASPQPKSHNTKEERLCTSHPESRVHMMQCPFFELATVISSSSYSGHPY